MIEIIYQDIAVGAKENATFTTTNKQPFINIAQLKIEGAVVPNYQNPVELNQTILDGSQPTLPDNLSSTILGWWSLSKTDVNGDFATNIVLQINLSDLISTTGFSLEFADSYPKNVAVSWYRSGTLIETVNYEPDQEMYFFSNTVTDFDVVYFTFTNLTKPYSYLKIKRFEFGVIRTINAVEIQDFKLTQEIDPISAEVTADKFTFDFVPIVQSDYIFQSQQQMKLQDLDGNVYSIGFIDEAEGETAYSIECLSYQYLLSKYQFKGGMYANKNVVELLEELFADTKVLYEIDSRISGTFSGFIPYDDRRTILMYICFVMGFIVTTVNQEKLVVTLNSTTTSTIDKTRIRDDIKRKLKVLKYTAVELTESNFVQDTSVSTTTLYENETGTTQTNQLVKFSNPHFSLSITNGTILEQSANHAIVNANANAVLTGRAYTKTEVIKRRENPLTGLNDVEEVHEIGSNPLINSTNSTAIMNRYFNQLLKNIEISATMDLQGVQVGEIVTVATERGTHTGRIISAEREFLGTRDIAEVVIV